MATIRNGKRTGMSGKGKHYQRGPQESITTQAPRWFRRAKVSRAAARPFRAFRKKRAA